MGWERARRVVVEGARFLTVVAIATAVSVVVFLALLHGLPGSGAGPLHPYDLVGYVIANAVGLAISYRGSRSWAFRRRHVVGATGGRAGFLVVHAVSLVIPLVCLAFSRLVVGFDSGTADGVSVFGIGLPLATVARFWALRRFVFLHPAKARAKRGEDVASA